jgi:hypothetical protein
MAFSPTALCSLDRGHLKPADHSSRADLARAAVAAWALCGLDNYQPNRQGVDCNETVGDCRRHHPALPPPEPRLRARQARRRAPTARRAPDGVRRCFRGGRCGCAAALRVLLLPVRARCRGAGQRPRRRACMGRAAARALCAAVGAPLLQSARARARGVWRMRSGILGCCSCSGCVARTAGGGPRRRTRRRRREQYFLRRQPAPRASSAPRAAPLPPLLCGQHAGARHCCTRGHVCARLPTTPSLPVLVTTRPCRAHGSQAWRLPRAWRPRCCCYIVSPPFTGAWLRRRAKRPANAVARVWSWV